jgi:hypothetical protein
MNLGMNVQLTHLALFFIYERKSSPIQFSEEDTDKMKVSQRELSMDKHFTESNKAGNVDECLSD